MIVETGKSKICRQATGKKHTEELQLKSKGSLLAESPLLQGTVFFLMPLTDWMRPTHNMENNLLYSKFTDLNANPIQKQKQNKTK